MARRPLFVPPPLVDIPPPPNPSGRLCNIKEAARSKLGDSKITEDIRAMLGDAGYRLKCQVFEYEDVPSASWNGKTAAKEIEIPGKAVAVSVALPRERVAREMKKIAGAQVSVSDMLYDRVYGALRPPTPLYALELFDSTDSADGAEIRIEQIECLDIRGSTREAVKTALTRLRYRGDPRDATHVQWKIAEGKIYPRFVNAASRGARDQKVHTVKDRIGTSNGLVAVVSRIRFALDNIGS